MGTETSKKKISGYQKLKAAKEELENMIIAIIERPHSSEAKAYRQRYKIENNLL